MKKICIELCNNKKIFVDLFEDVAPLTVGNFMHLIKINFYDNLVFHRIIRGFMCQAGGYTLENGAIADRKIGYTIPGEFIENGFKANTLSHTAGVISMARTSDPNSASSQFFICDADATFLDTKYAAFGQISDAESFANLVDLSSIETASIGDGFENFPVGRCQEDITIKHISIVEE